MSLQKDPIIMDDWSDLKEWSKQNAEKAAAEADNKDVTKKFVNEQISASEEKDNAEEKEEYQKIYQKIADISAGGGTDLSPYLKKVEAEETYAKKSDVPEPVDLSDYAKKSEIPSVEGLVDEAELTAAVADKATIAQVAAVDQKVDAIVIPDTSAFATKSELVAATENLVDVETFNNSLADKATMAQVAAVEQKVDAIVIPDTSAFVTEEDLADYAKKSDIPEPVDLTDYAKKSDIPDVSNFITEEDLTDYAKKSDIPEIPSLDEYAKKSDIPDVSNFATKDEIPSVDGFAATEYVNQEIARVEEEIPDISALATKDELAEVEGKIPSVDGLITAEQLADAVADKATMAQVAAVDQKVDAIVIPDTSAFITEEDLADYAKKSNIPDVSNFATKDEIPSVAGLASEQYVDTKIADLVDGAPEELNSFKELSDALKDQGDAVSAINAALATKATKDDISTFVDEVQMTDALSLKANTTDVDAFETKLWNKSTDCLYTKKTVNGKTALIFNESDGGGSIFETTDMKSFVGVNDGGDASTGVHVQIYSKTKADNKGARLNVNPSGIFYGVGTSAVISPETELAVKGDIFDVSAALEDKAEANEVPTKTEFEALKANYEALKQLVYEYLPNAEQEAIADGEISDLSPSNKSINIETEMASIEVPQTTTLYTVAAPLRNNSTVELTSDYSFSLDNTSEEPVNTSFSRQTLDGETKVTGTTINLSGVFADVTLENISIATRSGKDPATFANINVPATNEKELSINAQLLDGATIKNDSDKQLTITNRTDQGSEVIVVCPNSTVVLSGGTFTTLTSETADNTLIVNQNVNIDKLILKKGNVCVKDFDVSARISEIEDQSAGEYQVYPYEVEVSDASKFASTITGTSGIVNITDDLDGVRAAGYGIFANNRVKINLNNHTVSGGNNNYVIYTRGTAVVEIWNGTINATGGGYAIWNQGGTVNLHNCNVVGCEHAIYLSNAAGEINVYGGRLEVNADSESTNYVVNYLDSVYASGCRAIHLYDGVECVNYDPSNAPSETGHPNLLEPGYHVESYTEGTNTIYRVVKDSE